MHAEPGGWVRISVITDGPFASLVVENGGEVIDGDAVAQLAQPFRRLGADRVGSDTGAGLGLSMVAAIVEAHRGTLELRARPEGGLRAYDVVVFDRDLPGIDGDTLCQMITSRDDRVMVLMLTAAGLPGDRVSGLGWAPTTTSPGRSISPSWCCASGPSPVGSRPPGRVRSGWRDRARPGRSDGQRVDLSVKEFGVL